jgi:hypothetical protein
MSEPRTPSLEEVEGDPNQPPTLRLTLTRQALERLLSGDPTLEVALRYAVMENFAKAHLKTFLTDTAWQRVHAAAQRELAGEVDRVVEAALARARGETDTMPGYTAGQVFARLRAVVDRVVEHQIGVTVDNRCKAIEAAAEARVTKFERKLLDAAQAKYDAVLQQCDAAVADVPARMDAAFEARARELAKTYLAAAAAAVATPDTGGPSDQ